MNAPVRTTVNKGLIGMIVAVATIGGLLFGYDSGAVNGTQDGLRTAFNLSSGGLGFTVGSLLIGCAVGAFFAGRMADAIGRRSVMILAPTTNRIAARIITERRPITSASRPAKKAPTAQPISSEPTVKPRPPELRSKAVLRPSWVPFTAPLS